MAFSDLINFGGMSKEFKPEVGTGLLTFVGDALTGAAFFIEAGGSPLSLFTGFSTATM